MVKEFNEFRVSNDAFDNPEELRRRLDEEGYIFFRKLQDPDKLLSLRRDMLEVLREDCGIVSAKNGCAPEGACGCCLVQIDGRPALSCLRKPEQTEGHDIVTLEGLSEETRLSIMLLLLQEGRQFAKAAAVRNDGQAVIAERVSVPDTDQSPGGQASTPWARLRCRFDFGLAFQGTAAHGHRRCRRKAGSTRAYRYAENSKRPLW